MRTRRVQWADFAFLLILGFAAAEAIKYWSFNFDDAYISYRYADHLAEGHGLHWNTTDADPTEGTTSLLWVVILAAARLLGFEVPAAAKTLSVVSFFGVLLLTWWQIRRHSGPIVALFVPLALVLHPAISAHIASGMETGVAMLLVTLLLVSGNAAVDSRKARRVFCSLAVAAFFVRPDSLLISLCLFLGVLVRAHDKKLALLDGLAFSLLPVSILSFAKYLYFGHLLPNPFLMKQTTALFHNTEYVLEFLISSVVGPLLFFVAVKACTKNERGIHWYFVHGIVLHNLYLCSVDPVAGQGFRFVIVTLPGLLLITASSLAHAVHGLDSAAFGRSRVAAILVVPLLVAATFIGDRAAYREELAFYFGARAVNVALGTILSGAPKSVILATGEAGAIPYFTGYNHIDLLGLNNNRIAREGFSADYVMGMNPDLLVVHHILVESEVGGTVRMHHPEYDGQKGRGVVNDDTVGHEIGMHPSFSEYELARRFFEDARYDEEFYYVFLRRSSPHYSWFKTRLSRADLAPFLDEYYSKHLPKERDWVVSRAHEVK